MGLSKSMEFLRNVFLEDFESESRARVVHAEGSEKGFDHFRIYTQTPEQKENGIAMLHHVYSEEVEMPAPNTDFNLTTARGTGMDKDNLTGSGPLQVK